MNKAMLIIMDGWGLGSVPEADAIRAADTSFVDSLYHRYPHTTLITFGEAVGLPEGQMGNSEVGHLNIGAGRIVYQELQRINVAIKTGDFQKNKALTEAIEYARLNEKKLHLLGLVSDGGVHSHTSHVKALTHMCADVGFHNVFVHAFTDGRDTDPKSGRAYVQSLEAHLEKTTGKIASVCGRYYAMDRDRRWERVRLAYEAMVLAKGNKHHTAVGAIEQSYANEITDEFILPTVLMTQQNTPIATIEPGDAVIVFNFRTDRCREITQVLTQCDMPEFGMHKLPLHYTTMTEYDATYTQVHVAFTNDNLDNTIGEVIAQHGLKQLRMAETEKYPHVTFFFSGGREVEFEGEKRIIIPSPKVATYDLQPEMSAPQVMQNLLEELKQDELDFVCINFANADMVGHTGVWGAAVKAAETVDACVRRIVEEALKKDFTILLTADHGNSDFLRNADGSPNTAHTLNAVPLFIISNSWRGQVRPGKLADIAPTILSLMGLPIPAEMSGNVLIETPAIHFK